MRGKRVVLAVFLIFLFTSAIMGYIGLTVLWFLVFGGLLLALMGVFEFKRLGFMYGKGVKRVEERRVKGVRGVVLRTFLGQGIVRIVELSL